MNAKRFARNALVAGWLAALGACASLHAPEHFDDAGDVARLLHFGESVRAMSEPEQRRQHTLAKRAFAAEANAVNRLRLALLLTLPDTPFQCDTCARDLLRDYPQTDAGARDFAAWLLRSTERRLELREALETERKQRQLANQQLEKLKAIEQRLNDRDRAALAEPGRTQ